MLEQLNDFLATLAGYLWGLPTVCLLVGAGVFFTFYLGGIQFFGFKHALEVVRGKFDNPDDPGEINHFKALCTALSGTVGLGNIVGVAVAIKIGGPGATFWMIVAGLIGMATKYVECTLAVMYRDVDDKGVVHGGPMHYMSKALSPKFKPLAYLYSFCCIFAAFGAACMFQSNQVAAILNSSFDIPNLTTGIVLAVMVAVVIIGGIKRIGNVAGTLVPIMGVSYVLGCLVIIVIDIARLPEMLMQILTSAFSGAAAAGGFTGAVFKEVLVQGIRRAAFSNEAGIGTAAIAHSAAKTKEPVREGAVALLEPFIDTVVICTMTALTINITDAWQSDKNGVELTAYALDSALPGFGTYFIPVAVFLFAYSTMISWSYYGERSIDFLVGEKGILPYKAVFCLMVVVGAIWKLEPVLNFSDSALALMIVPNLLTLLILAPTVKRATKEYFGKMKG